MRRRSPLSLSLQSVALGALALTAGCATTSPAGSAPPQASPAGPPAAASAPAPVPAGAASGPAPARPGPGPAPGQATSPQGPGLPPFAQVVREARRIDGPVVAWQKDDKVWLELAEKDFGSPFFLSPKIAGGIGEGGLLGGLMGGRTGAGRAQWVEFRRVHQQVQLLARNAAYVARPGTPEARAVAAAYSASLVASTGIVSQPHPERRTVLVDATSLFMADVMGLGAHLQRTYRQPYGFDPRHSGITAVRGRPDLLAVSVQSHYAAAGLATPQPGMPAGAAPTVPFTLPDARSLFVQIHYSLSRLPAEPMTPRRADARLGHFFTSASDFGDDLARSPRVRHVNRWRLEKKDPAAAQSEPVRPITYWIDRSVPERYRAAITAGILEWNQAFEAIGYRGAIVVKVQPDDADFDTLDTGIASVRWMTNASSGFGAIGPVHVDPRSGEILDADIAIESLSARALRTLRSQVFAAPGPQGWLDLMQARDALRERAAAAPSFAEPVRLPHAHAEACQHAEVAGEQLAYALDVLQARDGLDPDGPQARAFVEAYLKDVTMHEVGHTLGLRHNFRASVVRDAAQLADPAFTRANALAGSVMDYPAINLPARGQPEPAPFNVTLGPYDLWAIEYAYRPLPPAEEAAGLARIAARSAEPALAFGTDEDSLFGLDPETQQGDLGADPIAFARTRLALARDLIRRLEARPLAPDDEYAALRRSVGYALRDVARTAGVLLRQIGGLRTLRDAPGSGRDPLQPVPAARQREALAMLIDDILAPDAFGVSPALQRRLAPDYLERGAALLGDGGAASIATDYVPQQQVADLQRAVLAQLMSDGVAERLLDGADKAADLPGGTLALAELHRRLDEAIWSDLGRAEDIAPLRRTLQRDHAARLAQALLQPAAAGRAEMRTFLRQQARERLARLASVRYRSGWSSDTRAHLRDSAEALRDAVGARVIRPGV